MALIPQTQGAANAANLKMAYEVEQVENHKVRQRVGKKPAPGEKGLIYTDEVRIVPIGYMVYFPAGHSIFVETQEELIRLGFMKGPPIVDMETGEIMEVGETLSPKEIVQRATRARERI